MILVNPIRDSAFLFLMIPAFHHSSVPMMKKLTRCVTLLNLQQTDLSGNVMGIEELLKIKRKEILQIAARHGAKNVRVFGSVARGEAGPESDVDFLVEFESERSLFDRMALQEELERLLGRKVDVLTEPSIYWLLRRRILKEAVPL